LTFRAVLSYHDQPNPNFNMAGTYLDMVPIAFHSSLDP